MRPSLVRRSAHLAARSAVRRLAALALAVAMACSPSRSAAPPASSELRPSPSRTSPEAPPPPPPPARFEVRRVVATIEALAALGTREATSSGYRRAAALVGRRLAGYGYAVRRQPFRVQAGRVAGVRVPGGTSANVVATRRNFDSRRPHVVVGAHLDTVPQTRGANDNASGVAVLIELARLASARPSLPVVFVAFGAEERRRQSSSRSVYSLGARAYVRSIDAAERRAIRGMVNLDMVGNGKRVELLGRDKTLVRTALQRARSLGIPARHRTTRFVSDHSAFEAVGIPAIWLWAGDHPSLHRANDTIAVVRPQALARAGLLAWSLLRTLASGPTHL